MGVYSSYSITKQKKEEQNIRLQFSTKEKTNQEHIGVAFLIFIQEITYYYLIVLGLQNLNNLL